MAEPRGAIGDCQHRVYPRGSYASFNARPCGNPGKGLDADGKPYCGVHDPAKKAARRAQQQAAIAARIEATRPKTPHERVVSAHWSEVPALLREYRAKAVKAADDLRDALSAHGVSWSTLLPVEEAKRILEQEPRAERRAEAEAVARAHEASEATRHADEQADGAASQADPLEE